ncbi:MAG: PucR family transcriptional regulator ligand-binding domain-containing protein [Romboutsia sp.]
MISCKDLLSLNIFKYIKLVGGNGGIYKNVTWTYICETLDFSKWVNGGELIFITGMGISLNEESFKKLVLDCVNLDISGLIILTNSEYINEIPISCIELANENNLPIFKMSWDIKLIDVTREISNYIIERNFIKNKERELLKELLFSNKLNKDKIYKLIKYCSLNIRQVNLISIFSLDDIKIDNLDCIINYIKLQLKKNNVEFLIDTFDKNILCLLSIDENDKNNIKSLLKSINEYINKYSMSTLSIGRGYKEIFDVENSYEDALNALGFYKYENSDIKNIDYDEIGFYKLLFNFEDIDNLKTYKDEVLGKLIEYDKNKNSNFTETLKMYLFHNSNLVNTANKLFIHRNTLIYRMNKIKSIIDKDIEKPLIKNELINAIMIQDYLNYLENK